MRLRSADKTCLQTLVVAMCALFTASCNDGRTTSGDLSKNGANSINGRKPATDNPLESGGPPLDEGFITASGPTGAKSTPGSATNAPAAKAPAAAPNVSAKTSDPSSSPYSWTLVLSTFTDPGHAEAAQRMVSELHKIAPQVTGTRVHTNSKGSMVVFGSYTGRDDPSAKADEERLKAVMYQGHQVFNRIMLAPLDTRAQQGQLHPYDLLSARRAHPNVDPLYTLDIGIWMANDDPKLGEKITFTEVKRKAEAYATQLRAQKYEAYFYHDEANKRSIVTVGLFDRRAINSVSGLYSDEVTDLVKKFPVRLANGEPMYQPIYKPTHDNRALIGKQPQTPVLVLVPTM